MCEMCPAQQRLPWQQVIAFSTSIGLFDQTHQIFKAALDEFDKNDDDDVAITLTVMQVETIEAVFSGARALLDGANMPIHEPGAGK